MNLLAISSAAPNLALIAIFAFPSKSAAMAHLHQNKATDFIRNLSLHLADEARDQTVPVTVRMLTPGVTVHVPSGFWV